MVDPESIPSTTELLKSLGTALGLGLLVGLQREWTRDRIALPRRQSIRRARKARPLS